MKSLAVFLVAGLLLPFYADSMNTNSGDKKACGTELVKKLGTMCDRLSLTWRSLLNHQYYSSLSARTAFFPSGAVDAEVLKQSSAGSASGADSSQTSGVDNNSREMKMKKVQKLHDKARNEQRLCTKHQLFSTEHSRIKQIPKTVHNVGSENGRDDMMATVPKRSIYPSLTIKQIAVIHKCCSMPCSIRDLSSFC